MKDATFSSARLLALYDRISDAEDAIPRLRQTILNLAVRGRLVRQDEADEPAAELLDRISKKRAELVKSGAVKRLKEPEVEGWPFDIPENWSWCSLGQLSSLITKGSSPKWQGVGYVEQAEGLLFITSENVGNFKLRKLDDLKYVEARFKEVEPRSMLKRDDILINLVGASIGRTAVYDLDTEANINQAVALVRMVDPQIKPSLAFLLKYLNSDMAVDLMLGSRVTTAQPNISLANVNGFPIPLPPLAEQHRIVAKVDELMALCDQLEQARAGREAVRDRLTTASLARLTAPDTDAESFRSHARFALQSLPTLTTRPDQIKTLRQTILNLAVRGKLVAQDATDEPASELLGRISQEKARLLKKGELKKQKSLPPIDEDETRFSLPTGWTWARLGDLSQFVTSGSRDWAKHYANEGAIFVRMGNLSKNSYQLRLGHIQRVNAPAGGEGLRTSLEGGDVLISITGDVGMLGLIPDDFGEAYINQHTAMVRPMPQMKGRYLPELFRSPFAQDQFNAPKRGIKNSFRLTDVTQFVVPLPPLAEQHRIVAKVDALMALCDQLEASLTTTATTRSKLLNALLHEALEPKVETADA